MLNRTVGLPRHYQANLTFTFHASSLPLFRQVRFFIVLRDVWMLGYVVASRSNGLYYLCRSLKEFIVSAS